MKIDYKMFKNRKKSNILDDIFNRDAFFDSMIISDYLRRKLQAGYSKCTTEEEKTEEAFRQIALHMEAIRRYSAQNIQESTNTRYGIFATAFAMATTTIAFSILKKFEREGTLEIDYNLYENDTISFHPDKFHFTVEGKYTPIDFYHLYINKDLEEINKQLSPEGCKYGIWITSNILDHWNNEAYVIYNIMEDFVLDHWDNIVGEDSDK